MLLPVVAGTGRAARGPARPLAQTVADGEVVWSWRPDAGVKFCGVVSTRPGPGCICHPQGDGGKKARSPGRARS